MIQVNVLYNQPQDEAAFEDYYAHKHMLMATRVLGPFLQAVYTSRCLPGPDGSPPAYYRIATLVFASEQQMQAALGSAEGQAVVADLENFSTGGHTMVAGPVDEGFTG